MNGNGPRAGGLRLIRFVLVALCISAVAQSAATILLWQSNGARVAQINNERAANVLRSCREVNQRHDNTIRALDELLKRADRQATPEQIERSRASTTLLIDALAPKRSCDLLVRQQVGTN